MALPSSPPDRTLVLHDGHGADVLGLIDRLAALEFERGCVRTQLEFHLHVRRLAAVRSEEPEPSEPEAPIAAPVKVAGRVNRNLSQDILDDLAKCGSLTTREIALHVGSTTESVRQAVSRLIAQARVLREGKRRYRVPETPPDA